MPVCVRDRRTTPFKIKWNPSPSRSAFSSVSHPFGGRNSLACKRIRVMGSVLNTFFSRKSLSPLISIFYGFTGITIQKIEDDPDSIMGVTEEELSSREG